MTRKGKVWKGKMWARRFDWKNKLGPESLVTEFWYNDPKQARDEFGRELVEATIRPVRPKRRSHSAR